MQQNVNVEGQAIIGKMQYERKRVQNAALDIREERGSVPVVRIPKRKFRVLQGIDGKLPHGVIVTKNVPFEEGGPEKNNVGINKNEQKKIINENAREKKRLDAVFTHGSTVEARAEKRS